jgi:carboxyl-terminal processing protease
MPWDKIDQTDYTVWNKIQTLIRQLLIAKNRISLNPQFKLIEENAIY